MVRGGLEEPGDAPAADHASDLGPLCEGQRREGEKHKQALPHKMSIEGISVPWSFPRQFKHERPDLLVTVPGNEGKEVPVGTLKAILKAAGLDRLEGE